MSCNHNINMIAIKSEFCPKAKKSPFVRGVSNSIRNIMRDMLYGWGMCATTFLSSLGDQSSPSLSTSATVCNKVEPNLFHTATKSNIINNITSDILLPFLWFYHLLPHELFMYPCPTTGPKTANFLICNAISFWFFSFLSIIDTFCFFAFSKILDF